MSGKQKWTQISRVVIRAVFQFYQVLERVSAAYFQTLRPVHTTRFESLEEVLEEVLDLSST